MNGRVARKRRKAIDVWFRRGAKPAIAQVQLNNNAYPDDRQRFRLGTIIRRYRHNLRKAAARQ